MRKNRFKAIEYASGFAVLDTVTGQESWISDGVDILFTPTGRAVSPGSKTFLRKLEHSLNNPAYETLEAYFPEQYEREA